MTVIDGHDGHDIRTRCICDLSVSAKSTHRLEFLNISPSTMVKHLSQTPSPKRTRSPKAKCTKFQLLTAFNECYPNQKYVKPGIQMSLRSCIQGGVCRWNGWKWSQAMVVKALWHQGRPRWQGTAKKDWENSKAGQGWSFDFDFILVFRWTNSRRIQALTTQQWDLRPGCKI